MRHPRQQEPRLQKMYDKKEETGVLFIIIFHPAPLPTVAGSNPPVSYSSSSVLA